MIPDLTGDPTGPWNNPSTAYCPVCSSCAWMRDPVIVEHWRCSQCGHVHKPSMSLIHRLAGFDIVIHDKPVGRQQIRFPKSKKKRIRKKWAKRPWNYKPLFLAEPLMYADLRKVICTSKQFEQMKRQLGETGGKLGSV